MIPGTLVASTWPSSLLPGRHIRRLDYIDVYKSVWLREICRSLRRFPSQCTKPTQFAVLAGYFVIFIVFGAQVLLSLFIGVISTSTENATEEQKVEQQLEERIEKQLHALLSEERVEAMKYV